MKMKKYVFPMCLIATFFLLASGAFCSQAFAVASLNAGNTTLAAEKIPPTAPAYPVAAVNTAYEPAGAVALSTVINVALANGAFAPGSFLQLCSGAAPVSPNVIVAAAPHNTSANLTLSAPLALGLVYTLSSANDACATAPVGLTNVQVPPGTLAGTTVTMTVSNATTPADPNIFASAPVVTVLNQFTATLAPVTSALDFATNEMTFVPSGLALPWTPDKLDSEAAIVLSSNDSIADKVVLTGGPASCTWTLPNAADSFKFKVVGDLHGIASIIYDGAAPYNITAADVANGYATLQVLNNALLICKSTDIPAATPQLLDLTAQDTTTAIVIGVRTLDATIVGGGGGVGDLATGYTRDTLTPTVETGWTFVLNATQYYIPIIETNTTTGAETYIKFQSDSTQTGANGVTALLLCADGTTVNVTLPSITTGTVSTITGSQLIAAATAAGKTVSGGSASGSTGFAAVITINAPAANIWGASNYCDASGCRNVPVEVVTGAVHLQ